MIAPWVARGPQVVIDAARVLHPDLQAARQNWLGRIGYRGTRPRRLIGVVILSEPGDGCPVAAAWVGGRLPTQKVPCTYRASRSLPHDRLTPGAYDLAVTNTRINHSSPSSATGQTTSVSIRASAVRWQCPPTRLDDGLIHRGTVRKSCL